MARTSFESLQVYQLSERLADEIWNVVEGWNYFARDTVGKQLVKAADSIGANIAEVAGRGSYPDNRRFARIARASLYQTKHWLRRAFKRNLVSSDNVGLLRPLIDELAPKLNAYLRSIGTSETRPSAKNLNQPADNGQLTTDN